MDLIDRSTREIMSTASDTITIECSSTSATTSLSVGITATPLSTSVGKVVDLSSIISGGSGTISYRWDYGDGTTSTSSGNTTHIYRDNGSYTVTLTIIDTSGNIAQSSLVIIVTGERDTDSDGIIDISDRCPLVYAQTPSGCSIISTYTGSSIAI